MRILIACTPVLGHVNPLLSIAQIFLAHGHEVIFQTASVFYDKVERSGVPFRPFLAGADLDLRDIDAVFPERKRLKPGPEMLRFDFERIFVDTVPPQYAGLGAILREWHAHVILADNTFYGTVPMLLGARADRPAIVHCGISCLFTERDDGAPPLLGLPPATSDAQLKEYAALHDQVTAEFFAPLRQYFDQRLTELGVRPLTSEVVASTAMLADLYLQPTVPGFEYPSRTMPASVRFVGALPMLLSDVPRPEWADEVSDAKRIVLVTQGTAANHNLGQLIAPTLAALADIPDLLVLATTGGRPLDAIPGSIPSNARVATFLPFDWLLPKVDVLVTNGGYGTVNLALERGIPLVVAGVTEDKAETSARVAWSGVGLNLATSDPTPEVLRTAVRQVLDMPQYRERAAVMARAFATYDAEADIIRLVNETVAGRQRT